MMKSIHSPWSIALLLILTNIIAVAQDLAEYEVVFNKGITIDGNIADWEGIDSAYDFTSLKEKEEVPYLTYFKSVWDSTNLYFIIYFREYNISSVAESNHEHLFTMDNCAELFLDLGADGKDYYELQVNAGNIRWELSLDKAYRDGGAATDPDELEGLQTAIHLNGTVNDVSDTDHAWAVELALPWKSLQKYFRDTALPDISIPIALNISRVVQSAQGQTYYVWAPMDELNIHMPELWGALVLVVGK